VAADVHPDRRDVRGAGGDARQRPYLADHHAEDSLSWDREEHRGWGVGLYPPDQANTDGDCLAFGSTEDAAVPALLPLVEQVLRQWSERGQR